MDVFLVPIGERRYDLYCEIDDGPQEDSVGHQRGVFRRLAHAFKVMLDEAERERRHGREDPSRGWMARVKARTLRWVAESIAEQRLLWHLRRQQAARLLHPEELDSAVASNLLRLRLTRDFEKHRFWLTLDSLALLVSLLLVLVPGPNMIGYYFAFRVVGHFLSLRGARKGLHATEWQYEPSAPLSRLRGALALDGEPRQAIVTGVARDLGLEHFDRFFARAAIKE